MSEKNIRSAMNTMTHGVYVIGTHADGKYNLMTAAVSYTHLTLPTIRLV